MNALALLYRLALQLYPRRFSDAYADEMHSLFAQRLREPGRVAFFLREMLDMPNSILREHLYALRAANTGLTPSLDAGAPGGSVTFGGQPPRPAGWEVLLAALPHLLLALLMGLVPLIEIATGALSQPFEIAFLIALAGAALIALLLALFKRGRTWAGSWYSYAFLAIFYGLLRVHETLFPGRGFEYNMEGVAVNVVFPLVFAFFLYSVTRRDPLKGLLTALPLTLLVWQPYLESTPRTIIDPTARAVTLLVSWLLLAFAAGYALRTRRLGVSLLLALLPLLLGGPVIVWLAVYQGGVLPFAENGPSLAAVAQFYLRTLLITASFFLAPQLAIRLRALSQRLSPRGLTAYRTGMAGLLMLFTAALDTARQTYFNAGAGVNFHFAPWVYAVLIAGFALYSLCFALLLLAGLRHPSGFDPLKLAAFYLLIGLTPVILFLGTPIRMYAPLIPLGLLVPATLGWIAASVWLVSQDSRGT